MSANLLADLLRCANDLISYHTNPDRRKFPTFSGNALPLDMKTVGNLQRQFEAAASAVLQMELRGITSFTVLDRRVERLRQSMVALVNWECDWQETSEATDVLRLVADTLKRVGVHDVRQLSASAREAIYENANASRIRFLTPLEGRFDRAYQALRRLQIRCAGRLAVGLPDPKSDDPGKVKKQINGRRRGPKPKYVGKKWDDVRAMNAKGTKLQDIADALGITKRLVTLCLQAARSMKRCAELKSVNGK